MGTYIRCPLGKNQRDHQHVDCREWKSRCFKRCRLIRSGYGYTFAINQPHNRCSTTSVETVKSKYSRPQWIRAIQYTTALCKAMITKIRRCEVQSNPPTAFRRLRNSLSHQTSGSRRTDRSTKASPDLSGRAVGGLGSLSAQRNPPDGSRWLLRLRNSLSDQTSGSRRNDKTSTRASSVLSGRAVGGLGSVSAKKNPPDGSIDENTRFDCYGLCKAHETVDPFCDDYG
jgi:hypothetical protein